MQSYPFIFSDKYRFKRHVVFWISWWIFFTILYSFAPSPRGLDLSLMLKLSSLNSAFYLVPHMFLSYSLMYWVVPKLLLQQKYTVAAVSVLILFLLTAIISASIGVYILEGVVLRYCLSHFSTLNGDFHLANSNFFLSLMAGFRGAITIGGLATSIKLMKYWYIKEQRNKQLQKENSEAQLQLLKAQIHPHFLFNTLNNIYSYTQDTSPVASRLVIGLSDMLRCMLYECNQQSIPLHKEIKLLEDYITLEKIRYGNALDVSIKVPEDTEDLHIAPLLLLPFVENAFKHGTSQVIDQPWLSLQINLNNDRMHFRLLNGKANNYLEQTTSSGIGIRNVERRIELLYPGKYSLKITNEEEVFIVDLKLELDRKATVKKPLVTFEKTSVA